MKQVIRLLALTVSVLMLTGSFFVLAAEDLTSSQVQQLLMEIDSLQTMQNKRAEFTVSGNYDPENADSVAEHEKNHAEYGKYLSEMYEKREKAKIAYEALSEADKELIPDELVDKLYSEIESGLNTTLRSDKKYPVIEKGEGAFVYRVVFPENRAYEISSHFNSIGGFPMTVIMVDSEKITGRWMPDELYSFGKSEYEVLYCCEQLQGVADGTYYKRVNLEDADYYGDEAASHIRAIVTHSYPYISLDEMKKQLERDGFEGAEDITVNDVIASVQFAIWHYSNESYGYDENMSKYFATADPDKFSFASAFHSVADMSNDYYPANTRYRTYSKDIDSTVTRLTEYLTGLEGVYADKNKMIISEVNIVDSEPVLESDGLYDIALQIRLNNGGSSMEDDVSISIHTSDSEGNITDSITDKVKYGTEEYEYIIRAALGDTVYVSVEGTQILPDGAYLYIPQTGKESSQVLVGVAGGKTTVKADAHTSFDVPCYGCAHVSMSLDVFKVNPDGASLNGAELTLYYKNGEKRQFINTFDVTEDGRVTLNGLIPGVVYELVETAAPVGYELSERSVVFEVKAGEDLQINWLDTPEDSKGEGNSLTLTNRPSPVKITIEGKKYLDGKNAPGFEIALADRKTGQVVTAVKTDDEGGFAFEIEYTEAGVYEYDIYEIKGDDPNIAYDEGIHTVKVTVTDTVGSGLAANTELDGDIVFNNITKTSVKVKKLWLGENESLPDCVVISLYANGEKIAEKTLTVQDGWEYVFADLDKFQNGDVISYTVTEEDCPGYEITVEGNMDEGFVITNTPEAPPPDTSGAALLPVLVLIPPAYIAVKRLGKARM